MKHLTFPTLHPHSTQLYWRCMGSTDTLAPCMTNEHTKELERLHPDAGCRAPDYVTIIRRFLGALRSAWTT